MPDITDVHGRLAALTSFSVNAQTGTTYTLTLSDANSMVTMTNGSASTVTLPTNAAVAFPVGSRTKIAQLGAGLVTVAPAGGVTLRAAPTAKSLGQYSVLEVTKIAADTWILSGAISLT